MRHCACCRTHLPIHEFSARSIRYCKFCNARLRRISALYQRAGRTMASVHRLHHPWNYWRRTPELDALYLDREEQAA